MSKEQAIIPFYALTLLISSFLLFAVQPLIGKMLLPQYGGAPAIWNTCMVFFQGMLLLGYIYAHLIVGKFRLRQQVLIHGVLLLVTLSLLPLNPITASFGTSTHPEFQLLGELFMGIGLPFAMLSTSAPLLQKWFTTMRFPSAKDPYFLYAFSNTGSVIALLGYPFIIEPNIDLIQQTWIWSIGYGGVVLILLVCGFLIWNPAAQAQVAGATAGLKKLPLRQSAFWIGASFLPSSLMLGVTTHITANIVAVPLLWVVPLLLYLITFILVFAAKPLISHQFMLNSYPAIVILITPLILMEVLQNPWITVPAHLLFFFVAAMVCHGELARNRPHVSYLTHFYLCLSVGGVLGGIFNALIAPQIFQTVVEYPLIMIFVCLLLPDRLTSATRFNPRLLDVGLPLIMLFLSLFLFYLLPDAWQGTRMVFNIWVGVMALICYRWRERGLRLGLGVSTIMILLATFTQQETGKLLHIERNFFGVKKVIYQADEHWIKLIHGDTTHGIQSRDPEHQHEPFAYFHQTGPLGDVFRVFNQSRLKPRVAVMGLGVASMATYATPSQHFTFYEIDPAMVHLAEDSRFFSFLRQCQGSYQIIVGDGRLAIASLPDQSLGMIILDVFSSDAIPSHVLTLEAIQLYLDKIEPEGLLVFHITNRFFNLEPLLANIAHAKGLEVLSREDNNTTAIPGKFPSHYLAMGRAGEAMRQLKNQPYWYSVPAYPDVEIWTDHYSNILNLLNSVE
ncbi:fused MFS/spermidine synthase [Deltaproteobacteria bacterium TL4]